MSATTHGVHGLHGIPSSETGVRGAALTFVYSAAVKERLGLGVRIAGALFWFSL